MHPEDYHHNDEARQRCWACSKPEELSFTDEDLAVARALISEGYRSTSNKYRMVARTRLPSFESLVSVSPECPSDMKAALVRAWDNQLSTMCRVDNSENTEHRTLTTAKFRAFKKLGGDMA